MNEVRIARITGAFGIACVALTFGRFPSWLGNAPSVYDGSGFARHLAAAVLWVASVPAMYGGPVNPTGFYNAGGGGSAIVANFPPMIWFLTVSVILIRRRGAGRSVITRAA